MVIARAWRIEYERVLYHNDVAGHAAATDLCRGYGPQVNSIFGSISVRRLAAAMKTMTRKITQLTIPKKIHGMLKLEKAGCYISWHRRFHDHLAEAARPG